MEGMIFRRIHGRIIPIKGDSTATRLKKSSALVGSGIATAAIAGSVATRLTKTSNRLVDAYVGLNKKSPIKAAAFKLKGDKLYSKARNIRSLGTLAGSALIGVGVERALSNTALDKRPAVKQAIGITVGGLAAQFAISNKYAAHISGPNVIKTTWNLLKKVKKVRV